MPPADGLAVLALRRQAKVNEEPRKFGISLRSATEPIDDTSTGKLMEGVLAAVAQFDHDARSDRTRAGMRAALELGRWVFLAPLGYINAPRAMGKSLMLDPDRAPIVRQRVRRVRHRPLISSRSSSWRRRGACGIGGAHL
jgi:DNA invertase Pin-like site-specific DNA recombinase